MKTSRYILPLLAVLFIASCTHPSKRQVTDDTERMLTFVKSTLYDNYGDSLALDTFWHHYKRYYAAYILKVDQKKLLEINQSLYAGSLFDYYIDTNRWEPQEELLDRGFRSFFAQFALFRTLPLRTGRHSYLHDELSKAQHPFLQQLYQYADTTHTVPYMEDMRMLIDPTEREGYSYIPTHTHLKPWMDEFGVSTAFRSGDAEIQQFMALYMWPYLSHCANIDVYSGRTRDALLREIIPDNKID